MDESAPAVAAAAPHLPPDVPTSLRALGHAFVMLGHAIMNIPQGDFVAPVPKKMKKEKADRKPRQVSAYNLFVKESSQTLRESGKYESQQQVMQALGHAWKALTPAGKAIWDGKAKALAGAGVEVPDVEEETEEEAPAAPGKRNSVEPPKAVEEPEDTTDKKKKRKSKSAEPPAPAPVVEVVATPVPASDKKKKKKAKA